MQTNRHATPSNATAPVDREPPMALSQFIQQSALSPTTIWRFRRKGFLRTVNICGRHYVLRSEIARFNSRAAAGEFAKPFSQPVLKKLAKHHAQTKEQRTN